MFNICLFVICIIYDYLYDLIEGNFFNIVFLILNINVFDFENRL